MKIVVEDANILLDLVNGGVLGLWLGMDYKNFTTHLVWREVSDTSQKEQIQPFIDSGLLSLEEIEPVSWTEIYAISKKARISVSDASVWFLAKREKAILLTGDSKLRRASEGAGLEVRGMLWLLEQLVTDGRLQPASACDALQKIREDGAFLPNDACEAHLNRWKSRHKDSKSK